MAIEQKYGTIKIKNIPDDEPIFLIRAQDKTSLDVIRFYANNARAAGASEEFADGTNSALSAFVNWQDANEDRVKLPD